MARYTTTITMRAGRAMWAKGMIALGFGYRPAVRRAWQCAAVGTHHRPRATR